MTSPAELYRTVTRRMSVPALSTLQSPFTYPSPSINVTFDNGATLSNGIFGFQARSPIDLLEAIQAHPDETFVNIRVIGNENIRLKQNILNLKQEMNQNRERHRKDAEAMNGKIQQLFSIETTMQTVLRATVERLENEVCRLRGGGRVVQGVWLDDDEFAASAQAVLAGETNWDDCIRGRVATFRQACIDASNGSSEEEDVQGKGKGTDGTANDEKKPSWNPNAVSLPLPFTITWF